MAAIQPNVSASFMSDLSAISAKLNLPMVETEKMVDSLIPDILRAIYRYPRTQKTREGKVEEIPLTEEDQDVNSRINEFHLKRYGVPFPPFRRKLVAPAMFGPPGHGKTSSFETAAKIVAAGLGWRYIGAEELETVDIAEIDHRTFVFVSHETAGAVSAMSLAGLPSQEEVKGSGEKYMGNLQLLSFLKLAKAGGGVLLLDDALNAARHIQDALLSILDRRRYLSTTFFNSLVGLTGNLGTLDGSNATAAATPLRGRIKSVLAHDTPENFIARTRANETFRDDIGDAFVRMFFHRYPNLFSEMPKRGEQGGFAAPRNWDSFIHESRDIIYRAGGRQYANQAKLELVDAARKILGSDVAQSYAAFLEAVLSRADPLARQVIMEGNLSQDEIGDLYKKGGFSARETAFAYQFAMALVDYTVHKIIQDDDMDEAIKRFGKGLSILDESTFSFGLDELKNKLAAQVATLKKGKLQVSSAVSADSKQRQVVNDVLEKIGMLIMSNGGIDDTRRKTLISVLSEMNKHDTRAKVPSTGKRVRNSN